MYADDLVLLSQSYEGIQSLLERFKSFCDTWNLKVNVDKTKIMISNKSGKILKRFSFRYENQNIEITNEYKYLCIIFKPSGTFSYATSHLSKKASKAIFCIRKSLFSDRIDLVSHSKLFEACVKPILLYCSEIWCLPLFVNENSSIESKYDSFIPKTIQIKYAKYILGVDKSATNLAVMSELGLFLLAISAFRAALGFWLHTINMDDSFLVKNAFSDNYILKDSFCGKIKLLLDRLGFAHVWDNQGSFSKARFLHAVEEKLKQNFIDYWKLKICDDDNKVNGNKLRIYRKLKLNIFYI